MSHPRNKILTDGARTSSNFFESDRILQRYLQKHLAADSLDYLNQKLERLGGQAATHMDELSLKADKHGPVLNRRSRFGERLNEIEFHPAYWSLMDIAAQSEMFYVKYDPALRERFSSDRHKMGFAAGQLYAMGELGQYCPLCMTDGAAQLVARHAAGPERERLLPKLSARTGNELYTGAMFLTEKAGGSDVGTNMTRAEQVEETRYKLNGEKWFCSNVNAEVIMVLARTGEIEEGTRGLSLFLVEKYMPDGSRNPMDIIRLKDKLGARSMATGEVQLEDTVGIRLGNEGEGFKLMAGMINISRTYNSMAAVAGCRRAIVEAWQYLNHRITFGKPAVEHALVRQKFYELGSLYVANFLLVWRTIRAMDDAENGDESEKQLMRMIIPMAKWWSAEQSVYIVRECMELMGGNGYIEDFVMPKLLRDVNVLPIWEGSGNIMVLDMLRAAKKSKGLEILIQKIRKAVAADENYGQLINEKLQALQSVWEEMEETRDRDVIEATAKPIFKELIQLYLMALMIEEKDEGSKDWIEPALRYFTGEVTTQISVIFPAPLSDVRELIGWDY